MTLSAKNGITAFDMASFIGNVHCVQVHPVVCTVQPSCRASSKTVNYFTQEGRIHYSSKTSVFKLYPHSLLV